MFLGHESELLVQQLVLWIAHLGHLYSYKSCLFYMVLKIRVIHSSIIIKVVFEDFSAVQIVLSYLCVLENPLVIIARKEVRGMYFKPCLTRLTTS
jgi:hypothetical protein